ncbi:UNVERIFIED_CONTAM: hypothetical protein Slati_2215700 [Sesamum latifolium]|uniref:Uncharacterized protein n=1 Tax=Sesamum latifolium TaxID=2727402 RepID=A0AAW2WXV4_9LAMI
MPQLTYEGDTGLMGAEGVSERVGEEGVSEGVGKEGVSERVGEESVSEGVDEEIGVDVSEGVDEEIGVDVSEGVDEEIGVDAEVEVEDEAETEAEADVEAEAEGTGIGVGEDDGIENSEEDWEFEGSRASEDDGSSSPASECPSWMLEDLEGPMDDDIFVSRGADYGRKVMKNIRVWIKEMRKKKRVE